MVAWNCSFVSLSHAGVSVSAQSLSDALDESVLHRGLLLNAHTERRAQMDPIELRM